MMKAPGGFPRKCAELCLCQFHKAPCDGFNYLKPMALII